MNRSCVEASNAAVCRQQILSTIKSPTIAFACEKANHNLFLACLALRRMRILRKIRSLLRKIRSLLRKFRIRQIQCGMAPTTNKRQCNSVRTETPRTKTENACIVNEMKRWSEAAEPLKKSEAAEPLKQR